jgi:hypothetical protein
MHTRQYFLIALTFGALLFVETERACADEYGFSTYALGGSAFGAGQTPPPGTYITYISGFYEGKINTSVTFGNVTVNAGAKVDFFQMALNGLYIPNQKVLGGQPGFSVTIPVGHVSLDARVTGPAGNTFNDETSGWGLGDITTRAQLGWQDGDFAYLAYAQVLAPSGRYDVGFVPIIGLNRPGIDIGWSFTWTEKTTKLQFNGTTGVTFNFENNVTDYDSGTDFHAEWAIGREICQGLMIGIAGYDFRQLTGDSGPGARLGPLEGQVDAIGPAITYTTLIDKTPVVLSARHYQEYNVERRWSGSNTIFSGTVRF